MKYLKERITVDQVTSLSTTVKNRFDKNITDLRGQNILHKLGNLLDYRRGFILVNGMKKLDFASPGHLTETIILQKARLEILPVVVDLKSYFL